MKKFYVSYTYYNMASHTNSFDQEFIVDESDIRTEEKMRALINALSKKHGSNAARLTIINIIELYQ